MAGHWCLNKYFMTKIESDKVEVACSGHVLFEFLSNLNNYQKLMPPQVTDWQSETSECTFNLNGMAKINMRIIDKQPNHTIKINSFGKVPFDFSLEMIIEDISENTCSGQVVFLGDLNVMMKMMVEKPLTHFFNGLAQKMKDIHFT